MRKFRKVATAMLLAVVSFASTVQAEWKPAGEKIKTRWGKEVTPENVWREYPRPQLQREAWTNLNGLWDYAITPIGENTMPHKYDGEILVPFCVESSLWRLLTPPARARRRVVNRALSYLTSGTHRCQVSGRLYGWNQYRQLILCQFSPPRTSTTALSRCRPKLPTRRGRTTVADRLRQGQTDYRKGDFGRFT